MGAEVRESLPSGDVTFLFTDIEGSTRRWEEDATFMREALATHDVLLTSIVESHDGQVFKHTGDGMCAVFERAQAAVDAAVEAQRRLELPVRMGVTSGEAHAEGADYFGPTLNRAARVMSAGHGGQVLVAESAQGSLDGIDLIDLGSRRLRDLSQPIHLYQVRADGLRIEFPPLKTVDSVPGNLPAQTTSFVGRADEVVELRELVQAHRLTTLVGVGGVGKTRLSMQVAAELAPDFADGVWFIELAPVSEQSAVPATVATTLGVTPKAGTPIATSLAEALSGRRLLLVIDNCEHVADAAADLIEELLSSSSTITILATSRAGLRIPAEHTWPVPPLAVDDGRSSAAVSLLVERAQAVNPSFQLEDPEDLDAATEICRRLDGIALGIELAAARMVSMTVTEVRDRLDDRFRLLAGGRRGVERHQTLRHAVEWSYDLLDPVEQSVLEACSVFADGFDIAGASAVSGIDDEYALIDVVDSLVRNSLVTVESIGGATRFGMLETIRQFGVDRLELSDRRDQVRERHALHFADQTLRFWETWDGPKQRASLDWVDAELANLRVAFRWAVETEDLATATAIAAHSAIMSWPLQRFEPVGWAEEVLDDVDRVGLAQASRLYVAASLCLYLGRPEVGIERARRAAELEEIPGADPFPDGWSGMLEALANLFGGHLDRRVEISADLAARSGFARVVGLSSLTWALPAVGRADEAEAIAEQTVQAAREYGSPFWIGWALGGFGRAFAASEPDRALEALREGLEYARHERLPFWEANLAQDAARLEAVHGEIDAALDLFSRGIDAFHRAGNVAFLAATLASLAVFFDRVGWADVAATIYGASTREASIGLVPDLPEALDSLEATLGPAAFAICVADGAAQELAEAVQYAHAQIDRAGREFS